MDHYISKKNFKVSIKFNKKCRAQNKINSYNNIKKCWKAFSSNTRAITEAWIAINPTSCLAFEDGSILTDRASLHITGPSISIVPCEVRACSFVTTQLATSISTSSNFVQVLSRPVTVQRPVDSWRTTLRPESSLSSTGHNQDNAQTQNLWCNHVQPV